MRKLLLLSAFWVLGACLYAQQTPQDIVDAFFQNYQKGDTDQTLNELYALSPWVDVEGEAVLSLKESFRNLETLVGPYYGHDLLLKKTLADCFELRQYIVRFDRQPLRFQFEFYKPDKTWVVHSFSYDDNLEDDLEEAARWELFQD